MFTTDRYALISGAHAPCPGCGYERTGLAGTTPCPECAALALPIEALVIMTSQPRNRSRVQLSPLAIVILVAAMIGFLIAAPLRGLSMTGAAIGVALTLATAMLVELGLRRQARRHGVRAIASVGRAGRLPWRVVKRMRVERGPGFASIVLRWPNRLPSNTDADEIQSWIEALERLRERALRHPDADCAGIRMHRALWCTRCGARVPTNSEAACAVQLAPCSVCGDARRAGVALWLGRRAPLSTWEFRRWLVIFAGLPVISLIIVMVVDIPDLTAKAVFLFWLAVAGFYAVRYLSATAAVMWTARREIDRAWALCGDWLEILTPELTKTIRWQHVRRVDVGPRRGSWTRVRVVTDDARDEDLWLRAKESDVGALVKEIEARCTPPVVAALA